MSPSEVFICMSAFVKQFRSLVQNVFSSTFGHGTSSGKFQHAERDQENAAFA